MEMQTEFTLFDAWLKFERSVEATGVVVPGQQASIENGYPTEAATMPEVEITGIWVDGEVIDGIKAEKSAAAKFGLSLNEFYQRIEEEILEGQEI